MEGTDIRDETYKGIIPRAIEDLFAGVSEADEDIEFCFKASYVEIYCEKVQAVYHSVYYSVSQPVSQLVSQDR
jgi:hypothetical protein